MFKSKKVVCILLSLLLIASAMPFCVVAEDDCNHSRGYYTISAVEATCSADGNIAYKECKLFCGYITDTKGNPITLEDTVIPTTNEHTFGDNGKCTYCGNACEHKNGVATCTGKAVCSECSQEYGELDLTNHSSAETVIENATAPSCTDTGYSGDVYYECCGVLKEKGVEIAATGHSCGEEYIEIDSQNHGKKCEVCGVYADKESHDWKMSADSYGSTCTGNGYNEYNCGTCSASKSEILPSKGHNESTRIENEVSASCSTYGSYDVVTYCADCNVTVKSETVTVPSTGEHVYSIEVNGSRIDPTCTSEGSVIMMCSCSAESIVVLKTAADAHAWGDWVVIKDSACMENGQKKRMCLYNESHVQSEEITALSHVLTKTEAVSSTCTSEGNIAYWSCSLCQKMYLDYECTNEVFDAVINKTEHHWSEKPVVIKDATCNENGVTAIVCTDCDEIKEGTKTAVPATVHDFTEEWKEILLPSCEQNGVRIRICKNCYDVVSETISKTDHADTDKDGYCDNCNYYTSEVNSGAVQSDTLSEPQPSAESENTLTSSNCPCSCHKDGFSKVIFNILNFFYKLFGINRVCQCGAAH